MAWQVRFQAVKVFLFGNPTNKEPPQSFSKGISFSEYGSEGFRLRLRRLYEYGSVAYLVERPTWRTQAEQYSDTVLLLQRSSVLKLGGCQPPSWELSQKSSRKPFRESDSHSISPKQTASRAAFTWPPTPYSTHSTPRCSHHHPRPSPLSTPHHTLLFPPCHSNTLASPAPSSPPIPFLSPLPPVLT